MGAGFIYATCVGNAVKWFPDRRGLAVGLTAAGFGAGAAVTVIPIKSMIESSGYQHTFLVFGIAQGAILVAVAWLLRTPEPGEALPPSPSRKLPQSLRSYTPREMLRNPVFWLLYVMFVMVSSSGLMATAQLALIASDFGISSTVLFLGASTLAVALVVDNIMNGLARPFFGWVSDQIGREPTMVIAFSLGGLSYLLLGSFGSNPWLFVLFAGLIFFTWGEIFSLFPVHLHRRLWAEVCDGEHQPALYRQGHLGPAGAVRQCHPDGDWQLVCGVPRGGADELRCGRHSVRRVAAPAVCTGEGRERSPGGEQAGRVAAASAQRLPLPSPSQNSHNANISRHHEPCRMAAAHSHGRHGIAGRLCPRTAARRQPGPFIREGWRRPCAQPGADA